MKIFNGIMLPFLGTMIGSMFVFFMSNNISNRYKSLIMSLASGIMISSAIWSLMIPSLEQTDNIIISLLGFLCGVLFLFFINHQTKNNTMLFSIVMHNIPEGLAVGVGFAGILNGYMTYVMALTLSIGIAIQNIPEGAIISIPLYLQNNSKFRSFIGGSLSGIVEPISAIIAFFITSKIVFILPFILAFASGTMIYSVIEDLLPETQNKYRIIYFSIGFLLMITLECLF